MKSPLWARDARRARGYGALDQMGITTAGVWPSSNSAEPGQLWASFGCAWGVALYMLSMMEIFHDRVEEVKYVSSMKSINYSSQLLQRFSSKVDMFRKGSVVGPSLPGALAPAWGAHGERSNWAQRAHKACGTTCALRPPCQALTSSAFVPGKGCLALGFG